MKMQSQRPPSREAKRLAPKTVGFKKPATVKMPKPHMARKGEDR